MGPDGDSGNCPAGVRHFAPSVLWLAPSRRDFVGAKVIWPEMDCCITAWLCPGGVTLVEPLRISVSSGSFLSSRMGTYIQRGGRRKDSPNVVLTTPQSYSVNKFQVLEKWVDQLEVLETQAW